MDDCYDEYCDNLATNSSSFFMVRNGKASQFNSHPLGRNVQTKIVQEPCGKVDRSVSARKRSAASQRTQASEIIKNPSQECAPPEPYCTVRLDCLLKLKDSTKKLLGLLEDIQRKTYSKAAPLPETIINEEKSVQSFDCIQTSSDLIAAPVLQELENKTKALDSIHVENEDDDCSIFKRLTRKCNCLNQTEYNDFVIHFNEDSKYCTSTIGEIIKNLRILKKFLYMGGRYTKNALIFLNEGLGDSSYKEKIEITQGCAHADLCNVFEDQSLVVYCISMPCKYEYCGDAETQNLAAAFLLKLAQLEEGRRYLKFTSKVSNDIKQILRKRGTKLDMDTLETLNSALNLMHPPMKQHINVTYYCRPIDEGYGNETLNSLMQFRKFMTLDEVFTHLDLLENLSEEERGRKMLTSFLPGLLILFKNMLKEYDNSEMNLIISNILHNVVTANLIKPIEAVLPETKIIVETSTEPIAMKTEVSQMPSSIRKIVKYRKPDSKLKSRQVLTTTKFRQASRRLVPEKENLAYNKSKKIFKDRHPTYIVVPIEKKANP